MINKTYLIKLKLKKNTLKCNNINTMLSIKEIPFESDLHIEFNHFDFKN